MDAGWLRRLRGEVGRTHRAPALDGALALRNRLLQRGGDRARRGRRPLRGRPDVLPDATGDVSRATALAVTRDGNVVARGFAGSSNDAFVYERDGASGALRWERRFAGLGSEYPGQPLLLSPRGEVLFFAAGPAAAGSTFTRISEATGETVAGPFVICAVPSYARVSGLAVDGAGDVVAALPWSSASGTQLVAYAGATGQRRWGPVDLGGGNVSHFALDPQGDVLWATAGGASITIGKRRRSDGTAAWGPLSYALAGSVQQIAVDSRGFLVVGLNLNGPQQLLWFRGDTGAMANTPVSWTTGAGYASFRFVLDPGDGVLAVDDNGTVRRYAPDGSLAWGPVDPIAGESDATPASDAAGNLLVVTRGSPWHVSKLAGLDGSPIFRAALPSPASSARPFRLLVQPSGDALLVTDEYLGGDPLNLPESVALRRLSGTDGSVLAGPLSWVGPDSGIAYPIGAGLDATGNVFVGVSAHDGTAHRAVVLRADAALSALAPVAGIHERNDVGASAFALRSGQPVLGGASAEHLSSFVTLFAPALGLTTAPVDVPPARCGHPYSFGFAAAGGAAPLSFSLSSGALPPGLLLDGATGAVSGTPARAGLFPFRLRVTDADGRSAEADFDITVSSAAAVAITVTPAASLCDGAVLSVPGAWASYLWVPGGETTATITVRPPFAAPYGVVVTDAGGCTHRGSVVAPAAPCATAAGFFPLTPCRLLDTREGAGPLGAGQTRTVTATGSCAIPAGARALALNVTAVGPTGSGFLAVTPAGTPPGAARTVAVTAGRTRAVFTLGALSPAGALDVFAALDGGGTDLVLDVGGYFR